MNPLYAIIFIAMSPPTTHITSDGYCDVDCDVSCRIVETILISARLWTDLGEEAWLLDSNDVMTCICYWPFGSQLSLAAERPQLGLDWWLAWCYCSAGTCNQILCCGHVHEAGFKFTWVLIRGFSRGILFKGNWPAVLKKRLVAKIIQQPGWRVLFRWLRLYHKYRNAGAMILSIAESGTAGLCFTGTLRRSFSFSADSFSAPRLSF